MIKKREMEFLNLEEALKKEKAAEIRKGGALEVYSKTITLIGGVTLIGKTITCLHFADDCVKNKKLVIYLDTDKRPLSKRPAPNLLDFFKNNNPEGYKKYFRYSTVFDEELILNGIDEHKPALLIIDSIYPPYAERYPKSAKQRAKEIRAFIMKLRDKIFENNTAVIITSQVSKEGRTMSKFEIDGHDLIYSIMGGEGLKHLSDTKWVYTLTTNDGDIPARKDLRKEGKRLLFIDRQELVNIHLTYGGVITKIDRTKRKIGE